MCARELLQNLLVKSCGFMHKLRRDTLKEVVSALIAHEKLTMTELGNSLSTRERMPSEKQCIKRVSNFLSNRHIHSENYSVQKNLAAQILQDLKQLKLLVDWTPANNTKHFILRASLVHRNSSLVLYQEVHASAHQNNPERELAFLERLKALIPPHIQEVLIITDAGFYPLWFREVARSNFTFIGRVRGTTVVSLDKGQAWQQATKIAKSASDQAQFLGDCLLTKKTKLEVRALCYRQKLKPDSQQSNRRKHKKSNATVKAIKSYEEGWFLVTNAANFAKADVELAVSHYKDRMKIESGNRTTKSSKYGFGFEHSMTHKLERLQTLLLIEQIASLLSWIVGNHTEANHQAYKYTNGSTKNKRRLSLIKLGLRVLKRKIKLSLEIIRTTFNQIGMRSFFEPKPGVP